MNEDTVSWYYQTSFSHVGYSLSFSASSYLQLWVISSFRLGINKTCALLGCNAGQIGSFHRRFGATYRSHIQGSDSPRSPLKTDCPETPAKNYQFMLRKIPEECRPYLQIVFIMIVMCQTYFT